MKKFTKSGCLSGILIFLFCFSLTAQDFGVQTFSFNDITKRTGKFQFPDNDDTYRKILMYYTLKCDPQTTQDKYPCGEWDYLTYTMVNRPTGQKDSTKQTHPHYRIGGLSPDTIRFTDSTTYSIIKDYKFSIVIDKTLSETTYDFIPGKIQFPLNKTRQHFQFVIPKASLTALGMKSGDINKISFLARKAGGLYKNFTVKFRNVSTTDLKEMVMDNMFTSFRGDLSFPDIRWYRVVLTTPFKWQKMMNLLVDVSYECDDVNYPVHFEGIDTVNGLESVDGGWYLEFDGKNDFLYTGNVTELNGARKFTYETWLRVDEWKPWTKIMGKGNKFHIELGGNAGEIYCINRNPDNTYGMVAGVIPMKEWMHIAMVFDGTKSTNKEKLKFYFNGEEYALKYNGDIPDSAITSEEPFTLSEVFHSTAALKGAMKESRVWLNALDSAAIAGWKNNKPDSSHPNFSDLLIYYPMNDSTGLVVKDFSGRNHDAQLVGMPAWKSIPTDSLNYNQKPFNGILNMQLVQGEYNSYYDSVLVEKTIENPQITVQEYEIVNHTPLIKNLTYGWASGYSYTYDRFGNIIDSLEAPPTRTIINDTLHYYSAPFDVIEQFELGRFITPYGINLDLGPQGFTWIYDVTDYAPLLKGLVDLSAGNQQELIDLKFAFYKGTPPRTVNKITNLWGTGAFSKSYASLSDDSQLSEIMIPLLPSTKQTMLRTRLTGHGHNSNDGNYPHCCEWKDNTHYLKINGKQEFDWHVWRNLDCAMNPVYPQGGTWPGSREGWCPGDVVKDFDFELTDLISGNSFTADYDITKVPENNKGMGGGNYVMAFQLFEYAAANFTSDVEVCDVIAPNKNPYYSRKNPICADPVVVLRNNGSQPVTSLKIKYGVSGGKEENYNWTGNLEPNVRTEVTLPVPNTQFWFGNTRNIFTVWISQPNGTDDLNPVNDGYSCEFKMPDLYKNQVVIYYKTNKRPETYTYQVLDMEGNVVLSKTNLAQETLYKDTLNLPAGCFTFQLIDPYKMGLSYWAYAEQGAGSIGIYSIDGTPLKIFNPDFGFAVDYSFLSGHLNFIQDADLSYLISVYPNPAKNIATLVCNFGLGNSKVTLIDESGRKLRSFEAYISEGYKSELDISNLSAGTYFLLVESNGHLLSRKFIKD